MKTLLTCTLILIAAAASGYVTATRTIHAAAIKAGVAQYNSQTADFEWLPQLLPLPASLPTVAESVPAAKPHRRAK